MIRSSATILNQITCQSRFPKAYGSILRAAVARSLATESSTSSILPASKPGALGYSKTPRPPPVSRPTSSIIPPKVAQTLGSLLGLQSAPAVRQRNSLHLYEACAAAADQHTAWALGSAKLPDTFMSWFLLTQVHVWMMMVRMRAERDEKGGGEAKLLMDNMVSHFFRDIEDRLWAMGFQQSTIVDKSLKELLGIFYGGIYSYDEALVHSDSLLASALWRNLFQCGEAPSGNSMGAKAAKAQAKQQTIGVPAIIELDKFVHVIRHELHHLSLYSKDDVMQGRVRFSNAPLSPQDIGIPEYAETVSKKNTSSV